MAFTHSWSPTVPADAEDINLGAGRIRDFKLDIKERVAIDHSFADDANDGLHLHSEYLPFSGAPTLVNATDGAVYTNAVAGVTELMYLDSAGHILQLTKAGAYNITSLTLTSLTVTGTIDVTDITAVTVTTTGDVDVGGALTVDGLIHSDAALEADTTVTAGTNLIVVGLSDLGGAVRIGPLVNEFFLDPNGGNSTIAFAPNTYVQFDGVHFIFVINSVLVGQFPP